MQQHSLNKKLFDFTAPDSQAKNILDKTNELAIENSWDMIFITDKRGKIIYINKAVKNVLGYSQKELIGRRPNFWMQEMPNKFFSQMWDSIYFTKKPFIGEIQDRKKDGNIFIAKIKIMPLIDKSGEIISFVGIERDITEIKKLNDAKKEFISLATHQLRTPITSISLTAEILLKNLSKKAKNENKEYLYEIMRSVKKMNEMIELFLNVSRIEMKTFEIMPCPSNIALIIQENIDDIKTQCIEKNIEIIKNIQPDLPMVSVDINIMNIILENLFSNSVKYTPSDGNIIVSAEKQNNNIIIKVSDTGYGILKKHQPLVFNKLFRSETESQKIEGVGLGLYLVKSLLLQTGGNIWLESEKNRGTTFFVSIPLSGMKKNKKPQ